MHTSKVSPSLGGFVAVVRNALGAVVAMSLPTSDRNRAARDGLTLRALCAGATRGLTL